MKQGKCIYFNAKSNVYKPNNYLISNYLNGRVANNYISTLGLLVAALRMSATVALVLAQVVHQSTATESRLAGHPCSIIIGSYV
jgi:hypothetical protein